MKDDKKIFPDNFFPVDISLLTFALLGTSTQVRAIITVMSAQPIVGYVASLKAFPLLTTAITGGVTAALGNILSRN